MNNGHTLQFSIVLADMSMEPHGGIADTIANLATRLKLYGVSPIVLLHNPVRNGHPYVNFMRRQGVAVWCVSETQASLAIRVFRFVAFCLLPVALLDALLRRKTLVASRRSLWGVLRRVGYWGLRAIFYSRLGIARRVDGAQLVHFFKPDMWPALRWMRLLRFKTLYTEETDPLKETPNYYMGLRKQKFYIDRVTAVSCASARGIQAMLNEPGSVPVIPNMVDLPFMLSKPLSDHAPAAKHYCTVGLIARLSPQKDVNTFLQACPKILAHFPEVQFVIHGDGPDRDLLTNLSRQLGIEEAVRFAGAFSKENLPKIMTSLDIVALSSVYEGFPITLLEAMAFAKPVVATAVSGVPEVVVDGVTGLLVPPRSPNLMAEAICCLIADEQLRLRMGQTGYNRYREKFTPETVVPQYVEIYRSLVREVSDQ